MFNKNNYVVILAGGIGSRFWPKSRLKTPKQFLDILGVGKSLIQITYERVRKFCLAENIFVITHHSYIKDVKQHLTELQDANIIQEPYRKNTAASAIYSTHKINALNPNANIMICPADHLILNEDIFTDIVNKAFKFSKENDAIITLGVEPIRPDTGYGYIQYFQDELDIPIRKVKLFTEKPNLEIAKSFLKSGDFLWNAGIFFWNVQIILPLFQKYLPEVDEPFRRIKEHYNTSTEVDNMEMIYMQCPSISIDHGLLEKAQNVYVIPSSFGWSDLGTWESAYENSEKDYLGNAVQGKNVVVFDTSESIIHCKDEKLVVVQGLNKYIIIDTEEILLICERSNEQQIKNYVAEIKRLKGDKFS
ncbi:MAG TPA: mannose-1-phosphate guanylyltransferase [Chitinophagaceae bacterium]|nr:mannose-1-phosphate guanylyltransferase [Chitinophagaceae bacterium]